MLYMSWTGATGITSWEIFADDNEQYLEPVGKILSMGFETMFTLREGCEKFVKVAAYRDAKLPRYSEVEIVS